MHKKMVLFTICAAGMVAGCGEHQPVQKKAAAPAGAHYQVATVQKAALQQTIQLPAQLAAYQEVSIFPKVNGYVQNVLVDIGTHVGKGQLLMTIVAPELEQQVLQAREKWARSRSDFSLGRDNYQRLLTASRTPGAISPMDLAAAKSRMESDSALSNSEKANWQMQVALMQYLRVTAPFSGVITERNTHPGSLVSAQSKDPKPMLELKQTNNLRLQVDIPENIAAGLRPGDTVRFYLSAFPGRKMTARVSRKSGNVDIQYRAERVELDVPNQKGELSPGMYAYVLLDAKGNPGAVVVPKTALVTSTQRRYVLAVRGGRTVKVDVTTGNESTSSIEVLGDLKGNEQVIVNANDEIREGEPVQR